MNMEGQLVVSVLEGNTMLRKLQPEIVFIPRSFVFSPCFCSHLWVSETVEGPHYACFLIQGMFLILVRMSPE